MRWESAQAHTLAHTRTQNNNNNNTRTYTSVCTTHMRAHTQKSQIEHPLYILAHVWYGLHAHTQTRMSEPRVCVRCALSSTVWASHVLVVTHRTLYPRSTRWMTHKNTESARRWRRKRRRRRRSASNWARTRDKEVVVCAPAGERFFVLATAPGAPDALVLWLHAPTGQRAHAAYGATVHGRSQRRVMRTCCNSRFCSFTWTRHKCAWNGKK